MFQIYYINEYYKIIRDQVGSVLLSQNRQRGYDWLLAQTEPLVGHQVAGFANVIKPTLLIYHIIFAIFLVYLM